MVEIGHDFSSLLDHFDTLSKADRRRVLSSFSAEDRTAFDRAVAAEAKSRKDKAEYDRKVERQFVGYSSWLAELVKNALEANGTIAREAAGALVSEHKTLLERSAPAPRTGIRGILDRAADLLMTKGGAA